MTDEVVRGNRQQGKSKSNMKNALGQQAWGREITSRAEYKILGKRFLRSGLKTVAGKEGARWSVVAKLLIKVYEIVASISHTNERSVVVRKKGKGM